jgi:ribonuclease Z
VGPVPPRAAGIPQLTLVLLGTGARWPTPERGVAAAVVMRGADHLLIDCGEGTQRQMMLSRPGLRRLRAVLVTHCHADHVLGLPGLLATLSETRRHDLPILGPPGLGALVEGFRAQVGPLGFGLDVRETAPGEGMARDGYRIEALEARHDCPALGWAIIEDPLPGHLDTDALAARGVGPGPGRARLAGGEALGAVVPGEVTGPQRRGRRIVYSGDTRPAPGIAAAAAGADLLVHEATFLEVDRELADRAGHSTAAQAAALAARAGVGLLALTHRSSRYPREQVLAEARAVFPAVVAPSDLDAIEVPLPERGPPFLVSGGGRAGP